MWLHPDIFCVISLISCNLCIHLIVYHFTTLHSEHDEKSNDTAPSKPVSISKDKIFGQKSPPKSTSNMTSSTNSKSSTASTSSNNVQKSKVSNPQKQSAQSTTKPMKFKIIPKKVAMQKQNGNTPNSTNPSNLSNPQKPSTSSTTQKPKISDPKQSNPSLSAVSSTDSTTMSTPINSQLSKFGVRRERSRTMVDAEYKTSPLTAEAALRGNYQNQQSGPLRQI